MRGRAHHHREDRQQQPAAAEDEERRGGADHQVELNAGIPAEQSDQPEQRRHLGHENDQPAQQLIDAMRQRHRQRHRDEAKIDRDHPAIRPAVGQGVGQRIRGRGDDDQRRGGVERVEPAALRLAVAGRTEVDQPIQPPQPRRRGAGHGPRPRRASPSAPIGAARQTMSIPCASGLSTKARPTRWGTKLSRITRTGYTSWDAIAHSTWRSCQGRIQRWRKKWLAGHHGLPGLGDCPNATDGRKRKGRRRTAGHFSETAAGVSRPWLSGISDRRAREPTG